MNECYPNYPGRQHLVLDGVWDFFWLGEADVAAVGAPSCDGLPMESAPVPGCYNLAGERIGQRGAALYRTRFRFPAGAARLKLGGLGLYARIWLDGQELGQVRNPYATISYDLELTAGNGGSHELLILVDNRFGDESTVPLFKPNADFYGYGGIYRSVTLTQLPQLRLERVKVSTLDTASGRVRLEVRLSAAAAALANAGKLRVHYAFDDGETLEADIAAGASASASAAASPSSSASAPANAGVLVIETTVPEHRLWSPATPNLHRLRLSIAAVTSTAATTTAPTATTPTAAGEGNAAVIYDTIVERFGIRTVATRGRDILLNGEPVLLLGLNRHESHPQFGAVQPAQLIYDDLQLARELNANFIRTAHYQPDNALLDACDRCGFLVWAESFGWHQPEADALNPLSASLLVEATATLVEESLNNPSVIIYGFLNESCSDTVGGRALYERLAATIRSLDATRLVSYASDRFEDDICFDLADVIAINPYPGWINRPGSRDWIGNCLTHIRPEFDRLARYFSDLPEHTGKPLLVSESGACGIYGMRDRARAQWSEEFQEDYFDEAIRAVLDNPRYVGTTLWQMHDTRSFVNVGPDIRCKTRGFNNAGLLDEYRRPKLAFDKVKELFARYGR